MDKMFYLAKTLSRTKRKDYENYIVNRVWNRLNDLEIKPVTQQYAKRKDGKYALIDLYFPQFKIGVECDEAYHLNAEEQDILRTEDIISAISDYEERRIKIFEKGQLIDGQLKFRDIRKINADIDEIVKEIKRLKQKQKESAEGFQKWQNKSDLELAKKSGTIRTVDNFHFKHNGEVRTLLGLKNKSQRCFYVINHETQDHLWLPILSIVNEEGEIISGTSYGHINLIEYGPEGQIRILEYVNYNREKISETENKQNNNAEEDFNRIVFARSRDYLGATGYKFIGVFHKTGEVIKRRINGEMKDLRVHEKVADEYTLPSKRKSHK